MRAELLPLPRLPQTTPSIGLSGMEGGGVRGLANWLLISGLPRPDTCLVSKPAMELTTQDVALLLQSNSNRERPTSWPSS